MIAHTLGNPFDLGAVKSFCEKYQLWLIEDNCDALGSQYTIGGQTKYTGTWGDIGTSSFYPCSPAKRKEQVLREMRVKQEKCHVKTTGA